MNLGIHMKIFLEGIKLLDIVEKFTPFTPASSEKIYCWSEHITVLNCEFSTDETKQSLVISISFYEIGIKPTLFHYFYNHFTQFFSLKGSI